MKTVSRVCVTTTAYKPLLPQQSGRPACMHACMQACKAARLYESNWGVSWLALVMGLSAELLGKMCSLAKDNLFFSYENWSTSIHMNHRGACPLVLLSSTNSMNY